MTAVSSGNGWKDTVLKVLVGIILSNAGWFFIWTQDVATKEWVKDNPPILQKVPALVKDVSHIDENRKRIEQIEKQEIEMRATITSLTGTIRELKTVVKELTKEVKLLARTR